MLAFEEEEDLLLVIRNDPFLTWQEEYWILF
jgi:hypothetical protein